MNDSLISIVTPVHNTASFLQECIESVLRQTHQHWEYIIVDNASTDGSGEIALSYASRDARIRVHRFDELLPQVPNYNRALSLISSGSRYVKVLEADNWLFDQCIELMVGLAEKHPSIGVVCSHNATESRVRMTDLPLREVIVPGREAARRHLRGDQYLFGAPTTVLIRASIVRSRTPYYDESGAAAEDQSACIDALLESDFGFVHQVLSFIRTENESILSKIKGFHAQELDRVVLLQKHGSDFFGSDELGAVKDRLLREYYDALALGIIHHKGPRFWDFHRSGLAAVGLQIDRRRVTNALLRQIAKRVTRPWEAWRELCNIRSSPSRSEP